VSGDPWYRGTSLSSDANFLDFEYSIKEATIIATGFSTVSVTFLVIVANTLDLMGLHISS
jgi:nucleoside recognition membrane protein YjiH